MEKHFDVFTESIYLAVEHEHSTNTTPKKSAHTNNSCLNCTATFSVNQMYVIIESSHRIITQYYLSYYHSILSTGASVSA